MDALNPFQGVFLISRHFGFVAAGVASAALTLTALGATTASAAPSAADCGGNANHMRVVQAIDVSASGKSLIGQNTKFDPCGYDDGVFIPVGKPKNFKFARGAKAFLLNRASGQEVSVADLLQRVHLCKGNPGAVQYPASCRNQYVITVNRSGAITTIAQRWRP
ncbi:hypothetical protein LN042_12885 [Kitasatospora sp. RB6PN24]|uniref:hypothetical protein n=1 Tax=Kitasatospora humi TaxID=2893891 RepID=UPI001E3D2338|nr:hypothetical protein [Kitasatospora humi]MCC9307976.1 hypothetical protein [Kitasatospora humi]